MQAALAVMAQAVLIITAAVLFYAGFTDLKHYKIRNELILLLAGLFFLHSFLSGRWTTLHWNVGFAAVLFVVLLYCYSRKMMGGGDLKLLTVAALWTGLRCALPFAVVLLVFASIHALIVKFGWAPSRTVSGKKQVAFAPSVAAALIVVFMMGCLQPS